MDRAFALAPGELWQLFERASDAAFLADDEAAYVRVNSAAQVLTGYTGEELVRMQVWDLTPEVDQSLGKTLWSEFVKQGAQGGTYALRRKDGQRIQVQYEAVANVVPGLHLSLIRTLNGPVLHGPAGEQRAMDLRMAETVTAAAAEGICMLDADGRVQFANPALSHILGYGRDELLGQSLHALVHPVHPDGRPFPPDECALLNLLRGGAEPAHHRDLFRHKDGTWVEVLSTKSVVRDAAGKIAGAAVIIHDLRETRRLEKKLEVHVDRLERLQALSAQLAAAATVADVAEAMVRKGVRIYDASQCVIALTEDAGLRVVRSEGLSGAPHERTAVLPLTDASPLAEAVRTRQKVFVSGREIAVRKYPGLAETDPAPEAFLALPLVAGDRAIGAFGLGFRASRTFTPDDLEFADTIAAQCAQALDRARLYEAETRSRTFLQQVMAMAGHDLRNPLQAITLLARLWSHPNRDAESREKTAARILASAQRMEGLIRDLVDYARATVGEGFVLNRTPMDAHLLVLDVVEELGWAFNGRRVRVDVDGIAAGEWDRQRLGQVLSNLVSNALQYSPDDSEVLVRGRVEDDRWIFSVHNDGAPIPEAVRPVLFEPFRRGQAQRKPGEKGLGFGLFIASQIAKAHHGTIRFESAEGQGTTFTVTVPRWGGAGPHP